MTKLEPHNTKQLQLAPLSQCNHHTFSQVVFPNFLLARSFLARYREEASKLPVVEMRELFPRGLIYDEARYYLLQALFHLVEESSPLKPETPALVMSDISVTEEELSETPLVVLTLTPVDKPGAVTFIALLSTSMPRSDGAPQLRYLTFERDDSGAGESAVLCEWSASEDGELEHRNLGVTGEPTKEAFLEALSTVVP